MERRRAGREEWKKRKWRRKGKAETEDGGGVGRAPDSRRIFFFLHDTHTNMQENTKTHTLTSR